MTDAQSPELLDEALQASREAHDGFPRKESDPAIYFKRAQEAKEDLLKALEDHWTDESPNYRSYKKDGFHGNLGTYDIRVNDNGEFGLTVTIKETVKGWPGQVNEIKTVWDSHRVKYEELHSLPTTTTKSRDIASFSPQAVHNPELGLLGLGSVNRIVQESLGTPAAKKTA